ncbi:MAG: amidohydrolase [Bacteroidales bacterium]|nr:amidohydrolase [Bacteroidales bacterium]
MKKPYLLAVIAMSAVAVSCNNSKQTADMIITNARIWTGNDKQPVAESMAVSGDTITAIGDTGEVMKHRSPESTVIDLGGRFVAPGFIDSHLHLLQGGSNLASVQLRDASTPEEFIKRIKEFAATQKPGIWILGGDWDGMGWESLPRSEWIDSVTPDNPVFVSRLDGHMALANTLAMELAGVDRRVKEVSGGTIERDDRGELTGIFKDNAMDLISVKIPEQSEEEIDRALVAAMNYLASNGVTSAHAVDAASYADGIARVRAGGGQITRIYYLQTISRWKDLKEQIEREGRGDKWVSSGGVKGFVDGSLGSHTAAFIEPYTDLKTDTGLFVNSEEDLYNWISESDKAGLQVVIHAIGDRAINYLLNTYERVARENGERDRRFRIEHSQHLAPGDIKRYAELKVIASMQPYHAIDDGRWAEEYIGPERVKTTYAFRSLLDSGATLAFGSDWFVAPATPLEGIYGAVTRRTLDGKNPEGWVPEQKITVEEALKAYTINAAYASFEEDIKGTLEPGKLADFVVLDRDITNIDPVEIWHMKVQQTWVGGKKVFDRSGNH